MQWGGGLGMRHRLKIFFLSQVIGIRQGELDLHGRPRSITWVRLAETANASDTSLHVQVSVFLVT